MQPVTARFRQALRTSHTLALRVEVTWPGGATQRLDVDGQVTVDAGRGVRRDLALTVPELELWRDVQLGGAVIRAWRGVRYVDGPVELVQLITAEVRGDREDLTQVQPGQLRAPDRWRRVQRARFLTPRASTPGLTVAQQWAQLVREAVPGVDVDDQSGSGRPCPPMVWERDRDRACEDLAASIGCEGFFHPDGRAVLRPVPQLKLDGPADWQVDAGDGGVLLEGSAERTDERTYSAVVVTAARTDSPPFDPVVVTDDDPSSATWVGGPFGLVPLFYSSQLLTNADDARVAGRALLTRVQGTARATTATITPNPALDAGDTLEVVRPDGRRERHLLEGFACGLGVDAAMPLTTRSAVDLPDGAQ